MLKDLARAIQDRDWNGVQSFYDALVGTPTRSNVITKVSTEGVRLHGDFTMRPDKPPRGPKSVKTEALASAVKKKKGKVSPKAKPKKAVTNKFEEQAAELGIPSDPDAPKSPPTPRKRPPFKLVRVTCKACGDTLELAPALVHGRDSATFRCDGCFNKELSVPASDAGE